MAKGNKVVTALKKVAGPVVATIAVGAIATAAAIGGPLIGAIGLSGGLGLTRRMFQLIAQQILNDYERNQEFTPKDRDRIKKAFKTAIKKGNYQWKCAALDDYMATQAKDITALLEVEGLSVEKRSAIKAALVKKDPSLDSAKKQYDDFTRDLTALIERDGGYSPEAIIGAAKEHTDTFRKAILAQQNLEKTALDNVPDIPDEQKNALMKKQKEQHEAQLKAFDDSVKDANERLHNAAAMKAREIAFLLELSKENSKNSILTKDTHSLAVQDLTPETSADNVISITDIETFYTDTDKQIRKMANGSSFTLDLEFNLRQLTYPLKEQSIIADMQKLATLMKEGLGKDTITMDVKFTNEELCKERAKQAYQACLQAGFPPDKITIKMNGRTIDVKKELFSEAADNAQIAHWEGIGTKRKQSIDEALADSKRLYPPSTSTKSSAQLSDALHNFRASEAARLKTEAGGAPEGLRAGGASPAA